MLRTALGRRAGRSERGWAWREPEPARADGCDAGVGGQQRPGARNGLPLAVRTVVGDHGLVEAFGLTLLPSGNDTREVTRQHLREASGRRVPVGKQRLGDIGSGLFAMPDDQRPQQVKIGI